MSKHVIKRKYTMGNENDGVEETEKRKKMNDNTTFSADISRYQDVETTQIKTKKEAIARAGVVEHVSLKNFKCHSFLEFELHPSINFILGRNGSGKSAVMDAIILCLGGNSKSTGRQANAKTFIKTKQERAELSVTLLNEGEDSYKPGLYGNKITIERRINGDGSSKYRILSSDSKLVSEKKSEIDNIVENFNIQVGNPVCFLNQETSKHFLNSSNATDKYKLFMQASQLESMKKIQEDIERERVNCLNLIEDKESHLPRLENELYEWEDKYKKCQSVEKLRRRLETLMQEYTWATVIEHEKTIENFQKEKRVILKSKEKHEAKINEAQELYKKSNENYEKCKHDLDEITKVCRELTQKRDQISRQFKEASLGYKQIQNDVKKYNLQKDRKIEECRQLQSKYEEEKQKNKQDFIDEKKQYEIKITKCKTEISELEAKEKTKSNDNDLFKSAVERNNKLLQDKNIDLHDADQRISQIRAEINNFNKAKNNQIHKFGDYMNDLCNEVRVLHEKGRFKELPRGPIGMYVEPVKYEWALAIEQCLGGLINAFVCSCYEDEALMHQLTKKYVKRVEFRPRIIVTNFRNPLHNVSSYRPSLMAYSTVYEMLTIKDQIVANALIDSRKIESILLLPNREVGRDIMEKNLPRNCSEAFLPNGDQLYGYPSYRAYACRAREPSIFVKSCDAQIELKDNEIKKLEEQKTIYLNEIKEYTESLNKNKTLKANNENILRGISRELSNARYKLKTLMEVKIPEPVDLAVYEEEIKKLEEEIAECDNNIKKIESNSADVRDKYVLIDKERKEADAEITKHTDYCDTFKNDFAKYEDERSRAQEAVNHYKSLLNNLIKELDEKEQLIKQYENDMVKFLKSAEEFSTRIDTRRAAKAIESEIQKVEKQIQLTVDMHGNEDEITRKYLEMKERYTKIVDDINRQKLFLKKLKHTLQEREAATITFMQSRSLLCSVEFSNLISSRNFNGNLRFDHPNKKLEVIVHPNKSKETDESRDLKSLSGGERSFSTVAFLLALWNIVESPILFLDEFDVFMDQINRRFAMELLIHTAKDRLSGQYVFLTPQEMGFLEIDKSIKVFKMPDPKRAIDMVDTQEDNENHNQNHRNGH